MIITDDCLSVAWDIQCTNSLSIDFDEIPQYVFAEFVMGKSHSEITSFTGMHS